MSSEAGIEATIADLRRHLQEAHDRGFQAGIAAARAAMLQAVVTPATGTASGAATVSGVGRALTSATIPANTVTASTVEARERAPRGRLSEVLAQVLPPEGKGWGLTYKEVEDRVIREDARISPKSVYNQLKYNGAYVLRGDRYFLAQKQSAEPSGEDDSADHIG